MELMIDTNYNTELMSEIAREIKDVNNFIEGKTFDKVLETFPYDCMNIDSDEGLFDFNTTHLSGAIHRTEDGHVETGRVWSFYFDGECLFDFEEAEIEELKLRIEELEQQNAYECECNKEYAETIKKNKELESRLKEAEEVIKYAVSDDPQQHIFDGEDVVDSIVNKCQMYIKKYEANNE